MLSFFNSTIVRLALVSVLIFLQAQIWFSETGYVRYRQIRQKIDQAEAVNEGYHQDVTRLNLAVEDLEKGSRLLDHNAREQLGMVGPGETLYRISDK